MIVFYMYEHIYVHMYVYIHICGFVNIHISIYLMGSHKQEAWGDSQKLKARQSLHF